MMNIELTLFDARLFGCGSVTPIYRLRWAHLSLCENEKALRSGPWALRSG